MKTKLLKSLLLFFFSLTLPFISSCDKDDDNNLLVGTWEYLNETLTFNSNGTCTRYLDHTDFYHLREGNYSYDADKEILVINYTKDDGKICHLSYTYFVLLLDDKSLALMDDDGDVYNYARKH